MPRSRTHLLVGAAVGLTVASLDKKKHPVSHNVVTGSALGAFFGKFPDILEPSINTPHHRQFFHSLFVLGIISNVMKELRCWDPDKGSHKLLRGLGLIAGCAYASHLLCDSITSRSLPLVGKL